MQNSRLIDIINSLQSDEFRELGRFVRSPFFNRLNNIIKLYDLIKKYYPDLSDKKLSDEAIFKNIYNEKNFNYSKTKLLISDFIAVTEEFLSYKRFKSDSFERKKYLLEELTVRQLSRQFEKNHKELEKIIKEPAIKGENYYYQKYHSDLLYGTHLFYQKDSSQKNNLQEITDNFLNYSLIRLIKLYTYMINEEIVYRSGDKKPVLINEIINHVKDISFTEFPALRIYYLILMLTRDDNEEYYFELKKIKQDNIERLDAEEKYNIDTVLRNFCTKMSLKGNRLFLNEYFEMLKSEIFDHTQYKTNYLSHFRFMNAVITSLKLKDIDWAESFINNYGEALQSEYKDESISLTTAMLNFAKKKYEAALEELNKIKFESCHHKMHLRNLTLQIYYELDHFEPAISIIDSYKHFLSNEKALSDLYRSYNLNFVKYYSELLKIKMKTTETESAELAQKIKNIPEFANKEWILNKLSEQEE